MLKLIGSKFLIILAGEDSRANFWDYLGEHFMEDLCVKSQLNHHSELRRVTESASANGLFVVACIMIRHGHLMHLSEKGSYPSLF